MSYIKTEEQISKIKSAGIIVNKIHNELIAMTAPGVNLKDLESKAREIMKSEGVKSGTLGYEGFPSELCISVNQVMVHGIAHNYNLKEGDIISYDVVVQKDGWYADACVTVGVGKLNPRTQLLIDTTKVALAAAIEFAKPGVTLGQLGTFIESFAKVNKFSSAKDFVGHGIGTSMHEDPYVFNYANRSTEELKEGMVICIEPMFIDGKDKLIIDPLDNWTVRPVHGGMTSHDEHTVVIRKNGGEILTGGNK